MIRSDNVRDGLFGVIHLSARSGAIVSAYLTNGVHGDERCTVGGGTGQAPDLDAKTFHTG